MVYFYYVNVFIYYEFMEENAVGGNQVMEKKRWLFSVTPLSKYLAMALFVLLPIAGFFLGMEYQKAISVVDGEKVPPSPSGKITVSATPSPELLEEMKQRDQEKIDVIIGGGCRQYFDGCNSCTGNSCTLMFCENYEEPRCLD